MAIRTIVDFFHPQSPDNVIYTDDLIHLGRPGNSLGQRDIYLTGAEFFSGVNLYGAIVGAPTATTVTANNLTQVVGFPTSIGPVGTRNEAAGTITITLTGTYRINMLLVGTLANNDLSAAMYFNSSLQGNTAVSAVDVPTKTGGVYSFAANFLLSMTAGEVINMAVQSDTATTFTHTIGTFDITPLALV